MRGCQPVKYMHLENAFNGVIVTPVCVVVSMEIKIADITFGASLVSLLFIVFRKAWQLFPTFIVYNV